jgi:hypothetical protein
MMIVSRIDSSIKFLLMESRRSTTAMNECLWDTEGLSHVSSVEEFLRTERELSLLCREAESLEAMRWLMTLEQESHPAPPRAQQLEQS